MIIHVAAHLTRRLLAPRRRNLLLEININDGKWKNIITAPIEDCVVDVASQRNKYQHLSKSVGYNFYHFVKNYFGHDCLKRVARDLLTIETEHNLKQNKQLIFTEEYYNMRLIILAMYLKRNV